MKKQSFSQKMASLLNDGTAPVEVEEVKEERKVMMPTNPVVNTTPAPAKDFGESIIGRKTVIKGEMILEENIQIHGKVEGNITTTGDIKITGTVVGNIKARSVTFSAGVIKGNLECGASFIGAGTELQGDMIAESLIMAGHAKGNIKVKNSVALKSDAIVAGDIIARSLQVEEGAQLSGKTTIIKDAKVAEKAAIAPAKEESAPEEKKEAEQK